MLPYVAVGTLCWGCTAALRWCKELPRDSVTAAGCICVRCSAQHRLHLCVLQCPAQSASSSCPWLLHEHREVLLAVADAYGRERR
jgi:hypothetical protein